jgi:hypothetical protein
MNVVTLEPNSGGLFGDAPAPQRVELSVPGAAMALRGGAGALDRLRQAGIKMPSKLPAPLNGKLLTVKRAFRINAPALKKAALGGLADAAIVGGVLYAHDKITASQQKKERDERERLSRRRDFSVRVVPTLFQRERPTIDRLIDSTRKNLPEISVPGADQVETAARMARRSALVRRASLRLVKIAVGGIGGALVGHKLRPTARAAKIGAGIGAAAGVLFSAKLNTPSPMNIENVADDLTKSISRYSPPIRAGKLESHTLDTLAARILVPTDVIPQLFAEGHLSPSPLGTASRNPANGPLVFDSTQLNEVRHAALAQVATGVMENATGNEDADELRAATEAALKKHVDSFASADDETPKEFSRKAVAGGVIMLARVGDEEQPKNGFLKTAAVTAGVAGAGAFGVGLLGQLAIRKSAAKIAAESGQEAANAFLKNRAGALAKLRTGFGLAKATATGALAGGLGGGRIAAADALDKLRRAATA